MTLLLFGEPKNLFVQILESTTGVMAFIEIKVVAVVHYIISLFFLLL